MNLDRFFQALLKNDLWTYESLFMFISYVNMQTSNQLSWYYFLSSFLLINLVFVSASIFIGFEQRLVQKSRFEYWVLWFLSFILLPRLVLVLLPPLGLGEVFNSSKIIKLGPSLSTSVSYIELLVPVLLMYLLMRFSRSQNRSGNFAKWIRGISFFRLTLSVLLIFAFLMPIVSNNFQEISESMKAHELLWIYLKSVPQIFLIYFSYYIFYYLNHKFLFPNVFEKKGMLAYIISLAGMILFLTPLLNTVILLFPVVHQLQIHPLGTGINLFDDINYIFPILVVLLSFPIIVLIEWNRRSIAIKDLEKEKSNAELLLLKQQINPHFFFNTLNNLYSLSLDKSDEAPSTILKLSKLMRFVIYKGQEEFVHLNEEVQYIRDYIDLQKIRLAQETDLSFDVEMENSDIKIPPLLFINLIENAFKHGIERSSEPGFLHITLKEKDGQISFKCENSLAGEDESKSVSGIGITNLRKRLAIRYPGQHLLALDRTEKAFLAYLEIKL